MTALIQYNNETLTQSVTLSENEKISFALTLDAE